MQNCFHPTRSTGSWISREDHRRHGLLIGAGVAMDNSEVKHRSPGSDELSSVDGDKADDLPLKSDCEWTEAVQSHEVVLSGENLQRPKTGIKDVDSGLRQVDREAGGLFLTSGPGEDLQRREAGFEDVKGLGMMDGEVVALLSISRSGEDVRGVGAGSAGNGFCMVVEGNASK
ncbi:hypothetical protein Dimus_015379, partial [Dionaea muscipula]